MEKIFNFTIWHNFKVVGRFRCKGKMVENKILPLIDKRLIFDCGDFNVFVTIEYLFDSIMRHINSLKGYQGNIDVDVYIYILKKMIHIFQVIHFQV